MTEGQFDFNSILMEVVKLRLSTAEKRRPLHMLEECGCGQRPPWEVVSGVADLFLPPRRLWCRPRESIRKGLDSPQVRRISILNAVKRQMHEAGGLEAAEWGKRLEELVTRVQAIFTGSELLVKPRIVPIPKDRGVCRPIAVYDDLATRIVLSLTARSLKTIFDPDLLNCVYAFRAERGYSHNLAVQHLRDYKLAHEGPMYVAECDIQKFFDTIHHDVAWAAVTRFVERARNRGRETNSRALAILKQYLESYTFCSAQAEAIRSLQERDRTDTIDWVDPQDLRQFYRNPYDEPIGVPQGGALSPLLANLVLDNADRAVLGEGGEQLFYARFCDDMIIVHSDLKRCRAAMNAYRKAMVEDRLLVHVSKPLREYDASFFDRKSKEPYQWGIPKKNAKVVPWVSFLGYQIRFDGKLRVRKKSIERQQHKQRKVVGDVLDAVRRLCEEEGKRSRASVEVISLRIHRYLIAMSTGINSQRNSGKMQPCWTDAFFLLDDNRHTRQQMSQLDRGREKQIRRLRRGLLKVRGMPREEEKEPSLDDKDARKMYFGPPYSYRACLHKDARQDIRLRKEDGGYGDEF